MNHIINNTSLLVCHSALLMLRHLGQRLLGESFDVGKILSEHVCSGYCLSALVVSVPGCNRLPQARQARGYCGILLESFPGL
jgi:hypothetical protein